jgi:hypothetical protein
MLFYFEFKFSERISTFKFLLAFEKYSNFQFKHIIFENNA